jgi:hypothetical protein
MSKTDQSSNILDRVSGTNGLKSLLAAKGVAPDMAVSKEAMERVLQQLQRDISADKDLSAEEGWAIVKAIRLVHDYTLLFSVKGEAVLKQEAAEAQSRKVSTHQ